MSDFLDEVLGVAGAKALRKAIDRQPSLRPLLVPRAILAWVAMASRLGFEGLVPAHDVPVNLTKTETGYSGRVGEESFDSETLYRVAARVAVAMGVDGQLPADTRALDLERLGKSLDALVKVNVVRELKKAVLDPAAGYKITHAPQGSSAIVVSAHDHTGAQVATSTIHVGPTLRAFDVTVAPEHRRRGLASALYSYAEKVTGKRMEPSSHQTWEGSRLWMGSGPSAGGEAQFGKVEMPGTTAKPVEQGGTIDAQPPSRQQKSPTIPRVAKPAALKLSENSLCQSCTTCGGKPAITNGRLRTCICYREMGDVVLKKTESGDYEVNFGSRWDDEARVLFLSERT
jgi:hypothetical protein